MADMAQQIAEKRIMQKESRRFKGKTTYHSDIVRKSQSNSLIRNRLFGTDGEEKDGGKCVNISSNTAFTVSMHYMAPQSSGGIYKVTAGHKTMIINTGTLFVTTSAEKDTAAKRLGAGHILEVEKGVTYSFSTGSHEVEVLITESGDFRQKTVRKAIASQTGLEQVVATKTGVDIAEVKSRKRMSKTEREELGQKVAQSRGTMSSGQRRDIARDIARGNPTEQHTVVGTNPQPIGDIGDTHL